ncbi:MAG: hypothetical protein ACRC37_07235 [Lentisphaeria bacterium]
MFFRKFYKGLIKHSFLCGLVVLVLTSCAKEEDQKPYKQFSMYPLADGGRSGALLKQLKYVAMDGSEHNIAVQRVPVLSAERIPKIETEKNDDGTYSLKLYLDPHAMLHWPAFSAQHNGEPMIVSVDEQIIARWSCESFNPSYSSYVLIDCGFTEQEADDIASNAANNYKKLNRRSWIDNGAFSKQNSELGK